MRRAPAAAAIAAAIVVGALWSADGGDPRPAAPRRTQLLSIAEHECVRRRNIDWTGGSSTPEVALAAAFPNVTDARRIVTGPGEVVFEVVRGERRVAAYRGILGAGGWAVNEGSELVPCAAISRDSVRA